MFLADAQFSDLLKFAEVTGTPGTIVLTIGALVLYFRKDIKEWREERRQERRDARDNRQALLTITSNLYELQRRGEATGDDLRAAVDEAKDRAHGVLTKFEILADRIERVHPKSGVIEPPSHLKHTGV